MSVGKVFDAGKGFVEVTLPDHRISWLAVCNDCWDWNSCLTYYSEYTVDWGKAIMTCASGGRYTNKGRVMCPTCVGAKHGSAVDPRESATWKRLPKDLSLLQQLEPWTWPIWNENFPPAPYSQGGRSTLGLARADLPPGLPGTAASLSATSGLLAAAGIGQATAAPLSSTSGLQPPPPPPPLQPPPPSQPPPPPQRPNSNPIQAPGLEFVQSGVAWPRGASSASDPASVALPSEGAPSPASVPFNISWYKKDSPRAAPGQQSQQAGPPPVTSHAGPSQPAQPQQPAQPARPNQPGRAPQRQKLEHVATEQWLLPQPSKDIRVGAPGIIETVHVPGKPPIVIGASSTGTTPKAGSSASWKSSGSQAAQTPLGQHAHILD
jgi:hypothetical protein